MVYLKKLFVCISFEENQRCRGFTKSFPNISYESSAMSETLLHLRETL